MRQQRRWPKRLNQRRTWQRYSYQRAVVLGIVLAFLEHQLVGDVAQLLHVVALDDDQHVPMVGHEVVFEAFDDACLAFGEDHEGVFASSQV